MHSPANIAPPAEFFTNADRLVAFYKANGRLPVQCGAEDDAERHLGDFLRVNRRALALHARGDREGSVRARVDYLDACLPQWRSVNMKPGKPRTPNVPFSDRVRALAAFVNQSGRLPSSGAGDNSEHSLARFLDNIGQARQGKGTMAWNADREAMLGKVVPSWNDSGHVSPEVGLRSEHDLAV